MELNTLEQDNGTFRDLFNRFVDSISFSAYTREQTEQVNHTSGHQQEYKASLHSHPGGFIQGIQKRRVSIAESYLTIVSNVEPNRYKVRIKALKTLVEQSLHAKNTSMPMNTARVQIAMIKNAIKNRGNRRRQMEIMSDFSRASFGQESVIRRFLSEYGLIEVPESDLKLKDLDLGWDSHVHDNLSEGRKTPTQLLLDAFIKGMSRLTVAYYDLSNTDVIHETLIAGNILGIHVDLGIEFSIGPRNRRIHFKWELPHFTDPDECLQYLMSQQENLKDFFAGITINSDRRQDSITQMLANFNEHHLPMINRGYSADSMLAMPPLTIESLTRVVYGGQFSRLQLRELLFMEMRKTFHRRVLALKAQYLSVKSLYQQGRKTSWELQRTRDDYLAVRHRFEQLNPNDLQEEFLPQRTIIDYDSAFADAESVFPALKAAGGQIAYIHPLAQGVRGACRNLVRLHPWLDGVELLNMYDASQRNPSDLLMLAHFVGVLNHGSFSEMEELCNSMQIETDNPERLKEAWDRYHDVRLQGYCSSDTTARDTKIPGMGFIRLQSVPVKTRKVFQASHVQIPDRIASLVHGERRRRVEDDDLHRLDEENQIYSLGRSRRFEPNRVGDEKLRESMGPVRIWKYLNPSLKNFIRVAIAAIPAYWMIGPWYTMIWFGITFFRNIFVDIIAAAGILPTEWKVNQIDMDNSCQSLFWTGFSVPLLRWVKLGYDHWLHSFMMSSPLTAWAAETVKFFFICFANGLYISSHNTLRGFDRSVIRGNFFRSVLAWPVAALFAPVGNAMQIPSIVQAKFWSDFVAGFIEGSGKVGKHFRLRKRDLNEILPMFVSSKPDRRANAMLDILFIWGSQYRGQTTLRQMLFNQYDPWTGFLNILFRRTPNGRGDVEKLSPCRKALLVEFRHSAGIQRLVSHVLTHWNGAEAVFLVGVISKYYTDFILWLDRLDDHQTQIF